MYYGKGEMLDLILPMGLGGPRILMISSHFKTFVKGFFPGNKPWKKVVKWSFLNCNNCIMLTLINLFAKGLCDFYFQKVFIYKYGILFNGQGKTSMLYLYINVIHVNYNGKWINCEDIIKLFIKSPYLQFFFGPPFHPLSSLSMASTKSWNFIKFQYEMLKLNI